MGGRKTKIAIASSDKDLDSFVDSRFSRCSYFLIVESKSEEFTVVENKARQASRGAGFSVSKMLIDKGVKLVIAGNFGPSAVYVLSQNGVETFRAPGKTAREALENFKSGKENKNATQRKT